MATERTLRVTMRYDNLYKYDVNVDCVLNDLAASTNSTEYGFVPSKKTCTLNGGYSLALLKEILIFLNLKVDIATDVWAYDFGNATKHSIDLFVSLFVLRSERLKLVDATFPTGLSKLKVFLNHDFESGMSDILFAPFTFKLWLALIGILLSCAALVAVLIHFSMHRGSSKEPSTPISACDAFFEGISVGLQNGGTFKLYGRATSVRLAFATVSLCFMFIILYHSGTIVALLSVPSFAITSLESLVRSKYSILLDKGYNNGSSSQIILEKRSKGDPFLKSFLHKASKTKTRFESFEKLVYKMNKRPVAVVTEDDSMLGAIKNIGGVMPCSWSTISVRNIQYPTGMFMRKHSPYKIQINKLFLRMRISGIMKRHQKIWISYEQRSQCMDKAITTLHPAKITNLYSAFIILAAGIIMSFLIMLFEILFGKLYFFATLRYKYNI